MNLHDSPGEMWQLVSAGAHGRGAHSAISLPRLSSGFRIHPCHLPQVSSAFSQLLNLHNLSEEISSAQLERAVRMGEVRPNPKKAKPLKTKTLFHG